MLLNSFNGMRKILASQKFYLGNWSLLWWGWTVEQVTSMSWKLPKQRSPRSTRSTMNVWRHGMHLFWILCWLFYRQIIPLFCPCWSGERGSIGRVHHLDRQGLEEGVVSSDVIIQAGFMTKHGVHEPRCKHHWREIINVHFIYSSYLSFGRFVINPMVKETPCDPQGPLLIYVSLDPTDFNRPRWHLAIMTAAWVPVQGNGGWNNSISWTKPFRTALEA